MIIMMMTVLIIVIRALTMMIMMMMIAITVMMLVFNDMKGIATTIIFFCSVPTERILRGTVGVNRAVIVFLKW